MKQMKTYTIKCKWSDTTYLWNKLIDRKTDGVVSPENNNAICKLVPLFMSAIQKQYPDVTSDRQLKMLICKLLNIEWTDAFMHFGINAFKEAELETAKTDSLLTLEQKDELIKSLIKFRKAGHSDDIVVQTFQKNGWNGELLEVVKRMLGELNTPTIPKLPEIPSLDFKF